MVRSAARLDRNHRRRQLLEEHYHLLASQFLPQNRLLGCIHSVKLENVLRRSMPIRLTCSTDGLLV